MVRFLAVFYQRRFNIISEHLPSVHKVTQAVIILSINEQVEAYKNTEISLKL
jgi:hypothetical protein